MSDYEHAFVFVDNHDNQRGHGGGGQVIVSTFQSFCSKNVRVRVFNTFGIGIPTFFHFKLPTLNKSVTVEALVFVNSD